MLDVACSTINHFLLQRDFMQKTIKLTVALGMSLISCINATEKDLIAREHLAIEERESIKNSPASSELNTLQLFSICFATLMANDNALPPLGRLGLIYGANISTGILVSGKGLKTSGKYSAEGIFHTLPLIGITSLSGDTMGTYPNILNNFRKAAYYTLGVKCAEYFFRDKTKEKK